MNHRDYDGSVPLLSIDKWPDSEAQCQKLFKKRARYLGWNAHAVNSGWQGDNDPGWPDLALWREKGEEYPQVLLVECKGHRTEIKPDQIACVKIIGTYAPAYILRFPRDAALADTLLEYGGHTDDHGY